ncbi:hypothetical protein [Bacteroides heparinolyticus]
MEDIHPWQGLRPSPPTNLEHVFAKQLNAKLVDESALKNIFFSVLHTL